MKDKTPEFEKMACLIVVSCFYSIISVSLPSAYPVVWVIFVTEQLCQRYEVRIWWKASHHLRLVSNMTKKEISKKRLWWCYQGLSKQSVSTQNLIVRIKDDFSIPRRVTKARNSSNAESHSTESTRSCVYWKHTPRLVTWLSFPALRESWVSPEYCNSGTRKESCYKE